MTDKDTHYDDEDGEEIVSKSQVKRDMLALQDLAVYITKMKPELQALLPLDDTLRRAIDETKNIKKREALRRHFQYLGKLIRDSDHEAIQAAIDNQKEKQNRLVRLMHVMEQWRDDLIADEPQILERFFNEFPHADRQQIRNLVRSAQHEKRHNKGVAGSRKLFRYIRDVVENATESGE